MLMSSVTKRVSTNSVRNFSRVDPKFTDFKQSSCSENLFKNRTSDISGVDSGFLVEGGSATKLNEPIIGGKL